jgi:hypothetical protein
MMKMIKNSLENLNKETDKTKDNKARKLLLKVEEDQEEEIL